MSSHGQFLATQSRGPGGYGLSDVASSIDFYLLLGSTLYSYTRQSISRYGGI